MKIAKLKNYKSLATIFLLLASIAALLPIVPYSAVKVILASLFLLLVPGHLLTRLIVPRRWPHQFIEGVAYSVGLSILYLMIIGLVVSSIFPPLLNIKAPLSAWPLDIVILSTTAMLAVWVKLWGRRLLPNWSISRYSKQDRATFAIGLLLPLLGSIGAITLNNSGSNSLALLSLGAIVGYCILVGWSTREHKSIIYSCALYLISLSMLLSSSLRGWHITGHDVIQEYQVFQFTSSHSFWSMSFLHDAYNACLSITILPTILQKITKLSDPYIYKILFQMIFAIVPPTLYLLFNRFVIKKQAYLAALIFITFPTFITDMSMLGRQEIALLCFVLFFASLFDRGIVDNKLSKNVLLFSFGLGMILSHYSTSYVAFAVIGFAKGLEYAVIIFQKLFLGKRHQIRTGRWMPINLPIIVVLLSCLFIWNGLITKTSSGITTTVKNVVASVPKLFKSNAHTGERGYSIVGSTIPTSDLFSNYIQSTPQLKRDLPMDQYYPDAQTQGYQPQKLKDPSSDSTSHIFDYLKNTYAKLIQALIIFGLIAVIFLPKGFSMPWQYYYIGLGCMALIGLQVLLPIAAIDYGLLRLLQQSLVFLAVPIVCIGYIILAKIKIPRDLHSRILLSIFVGFFIVTSGLAPALTGTYKPALITSNSGFYYEAYYTHTDDLAGFEWLKTHTPKGSIVNSDEFSRRRMITYAGIYARASLVPSAVAKDSYVFLSHSNNLFNNVPFYFTGELMYHELPVQFLIAKKNLVYSNGLVKIYH